MPRISLVPFQPAHAKALRLRPRASAALRGLPPLPELAAAYAAAGPVWSLLGGETPLACGGAVRFWPGVGELWCWAGQEADADPVALARCARRLVDALAREHGFHRLQAHVREADTRAQAFAAFLGLRYEGRCQVYGADQSTHLLYGRFYGWKA